MKTIFHKAETRGSADHGWLKTYHTFSFANYYDPERVHFGTLRVLNDDYVAAGKGFGMHPHDNMEIITIPLEGDLQHKDNMGNQEIIREGDVQVMSAGTGVYHSEFNPNSDKAVQLLQIWVFPNKKNVKPRYDQISLEDIKRDNEFYQILSPDSKDQGVWIHQDAWFSLGKCEAGKEATYQLKRAENGVYAFVIEGEVTVNDKPLKKRDGLGIWDVEELNVVCNTNARLLLMEVPMEIKN
ncbi:pirin family protein [Maribellus mangrovi]|uniref:pirin family protein n=1 Tax=Maribellus mangrovi TaxID=3133146 RepID=UPI0030EF7E6C